MICKYKLFFDDKEYELDSQCIRNWDNIKCTLERKDFSGIVRSFSSEIEFVNEAYSLLKNKYLETGINTSVIFAIYSINDQWSFDKIFECPLDFSSISWDAYVLKISCVDDNLSALIKANGGTKFEFTIGEDIVVDNHLFYDRVSMINTASHEITGDGIDDRGNTLVGVASSMSRLATYAIGESETFENSPILVSDEDTEDGGCIAEIVKSTEYIEFEIEIHNNLGGAYLTQTDSLDIYLMEFDKSDVSYNSNYKNLGSIFSTSKTSIFSRTYIGVFSSFEELVRAYPNPPSDVWAAIGNSREDAEEVYYTPITNDSSKIKWEKGQLVIYGNRSNNVKWCWDRKYITTIKISNPAVGKKYALFYTASLYFNSSLSTRTPYCYIDSSIKTRWMSRAIPIEIDTITPKELLKSLLLKVCGGNIKATPYISDEDTRINNTYIVAAESIRGISGAKLYSSFNDFCEWIETVFGYTYYLGNRIKSRFVKLMTYDSYSSSTLPDYEDDYCPDENKSDITFYEQEQLFLVFNSNNGKFYNQWNDSEYYNDTITQKARRDILFEESILKTAFYINDEGVVTKYNDDISMYDKDSQDVFFVHRNSLFNGTNTINVDDAIDLQYKINTGLLYSTIEIGYEKQDYETICGRDEWNFTNYYTTGISVSDKKLTLKSKYRADCYGFEFLSQERSNDTTDNKSDSDIFFVHCKTEQEEASDNEESTISTRLVIDRSSAIEGALSDTVFNGEYSPLKCLKSNLSYIGAIADILNIQHTASDGNSDIVIDGEPMSASIISDSPLFSIGELSFKAPKCDFSIRNEDLIKVDFFGENYIGFVKQVEINEAKEESVQYTLIVKTIEL